MNPEISIVIPAFNEEHYIEACLKSLQNQDFFGSYEVIVVDNNSTDRTHALAEQLGARVVNEPQQGVCAARQAGTEAATGNIIVSTDADTVFPRNWLSRIAAGFAENPDAVAVAGACEYMNAPWWARVYARALFGGVNLRYTRTGSVGYISACNTAFRKDAWTGYNVRLTQGGDEFFLLKQLKQKGRIVFQRDNVVTTSSRRLNKGLWYNAVVTITWFYGFNYLIGRFTGRSPLGSYAPIRSERPTSKLSRALTRSVTAALIIVAAISIASHNVSAARAINATGAKIETLSDNVTAIPAIRNTTTHVARLTVRILTTPVVASTTSQLGKLAARIPHPHHAHRTQER